MTGTKTQNTNKTELAVSRKQQIRASFSRLSRELGDAGAIAYIAGQLSSASEFKALSVRERITLIQATVGMTVSYQTKG